MTIPLAPNPIERRRADERLRHLATQRYRTDADGFGQHLTSAIDAILSHRSIRSYSPEHPPLGSVELAIAAAQSAPTSSNLQLWSVIAVTDPARKARLGELAAVNRHIAQAPLLLVWIADLSRARAIASAHGEAGEGLDYLELLLLATIDASLAAQNAVIALELLGLGSCYIGAMRNHPEVVAVELSLPAESVALFGLTVGYPSPDSVADIKPRLPQGVVLHREQYRSQAHDLADYNSVLRDFQAEQGMPLIDWTAQVAQRIGTIAALKGRDGLSEALKRLGFKLK